MLVILGLAFAVDFAGWLQGGNLAGVWSIVVATPVMLILIGHMITLRPRPVLPYNPQVVVGAVIIILAGIVILPVQLLSMRIGFFVFDLIFAVILAAILLAQNLKQQASGDSSEESTGPQNHATPNEFAE